MKKSAFVIVLSLLAITLSAQEPKEWAPAYFSKDYVVVAVNAHTTDSELLQIRKNILKYSMIRFTNFDVIRADDGSIYFLSMEVDCRDGYNGKISHAFEPGDTTYYGFVRDYSLNTYKKPFFIGNLLSPYSGINHVEEYIATKKQEEDNAE
ncbi:MAG: hypothetical protein IJ681_06660 [Bacteroidales bacterium]|nr:hypothetical protein [Bacteroidales bacterium]